MNECFEIAKGKNYFGLREWKISSVFHGGGGGGNDDGLLLKENSMNFELKNLFLCKTKACRVRCKESHYTTFIVGR